MNDKTIIRGDSYALRRPVYVYTFADYRGEPFNFSGCTILSTFKNQIIPIEQDPEDSSAPVRQELIIDLDGNVVKEDGLHLRGTASEGTIEQRLTSSQTAQLPSDMRLITDIQITDAIGETFTWTFVDGIVATDSVTNRME